MKCLSSLLPVILIALSCNNPKEIDLRFKMPAGAKFEHVMNMDMSLGEVKGGKEAKMENSMSFTYLFEVLSDSASWKKLSTTITRIKMGMNAMGGTVHFDSDQPGTDTTGPAAAMGKIMGALKGGRLSFFVNDKGEVGRIEGYDAIRERMIAASPQASMMGGSIFSEETFRQNIRQSFAAYPDKPVKEGESWVRTTTVNVQGVVVKSENTYTLQSVTGNDVAIKIQSRLSSGGSTVSGIQRSMTGTSTGTMHYDTTGMPLNGTLDMKMDMKMKGQGKEIPMTVNSKLTLIGKKL